MAHFKTHLFSKWFPTSGSRHKAQHYDERVLFYIRHVCNCSILLRNALAARAACRSFLDTNNTFPK